MSPFALYLIVNQEIDKLRNEQPRRFFAYEAIRESGPSVLQRIRSAFGSVDGEAPAVTPSLLDYPYRS